MKRREKAAVSNGRRDERVRQRIEELREKKKTPQVSFQILKYSISFFKCIHSLITVSTAPLPVDDGRAAWASKSTSAVTWSEDSPVTRR